MSNFAQATREKLRFSAKQGLLTTEQLWDLGITALANMVRRLGTQLKSENNDDEFAFLDDAPSKVDKTLELQFNVAKEIYLVRKAEREEAKTKAAKKENNEKIMALIARKQEGELEGKSIAELTAMLEN